MRFRFLIPAAALLLLTACGNADTQTIDTLIAQQAEADASSAAPNADAPAPTVPVPDSANGEYDVDLTTLESNMVYAQVYDMVTNTDNYKDKRIRVRGTFNYYQNPDTKREYFAVLVNDATACCAQGIEFVLPDSYKYPDDYPEQGTPIEVIGLYSVYTEDDQPFVELQNASMTVLP